MQFILDILKSILFGIVQGITEWLPISSTGHLILLDSVLPLEPAAFFEVFKVVIQFGSILAVVVLYFHRLNPWSKKKSRAKQKETFELWKKVIVGAIPAAILGFLLDDIIEGYLSANFIIAITLIAYGIIFIVVEKHPKTPTIHTLDELDYKTSLKIGCFQCLALIPGTSRSGSTILGGLYSGCTRTIASEFSFFVAVPIMLGASGLKLVKYFMESGFFSFGQLIVLLFGTFISFVVSLFAIRALLSYVRKHDFTVFGWYRIVLGILVILFFYVL